MKPEEAIKILQERIDLIKQNQSYMQDQNIMEYCEALEFVIKELEEKQTFSKKCDDEYRKQQLWNSIMHDLGIK